MARFSRQSRPGIAHPSARPGARLAWLLVNCINAGVTDTPTLRAIPGNESMIAETLRRSPQHRLTTTEDVATTIVALSQPEIKFISASVTFVDGGESIMP